MKTWLIPAACFALGATPAAARTRLTRSEAAEARTAQPSARNVRITVDVNGTPAPGKSISVSAYAHEQAPWLLVECYRNENHAQWDDWHRVFSGLDYRQPEGDGQLRSSYFHIAVCMLEWQAMAELTDADRARSVIAWKQRDHHPAAYRILLQRGDSVEAVLNRRGIEVVSATPESND